jgi:hypothetical protein
MKGVDKFNRKFIVIKANIYYADNTFTETFTTIFQRYSNDELHFVGCGHYGNHLFYTDGGMDNNQFELINNLLKNNIFYLNENIINKCRIKYLKTNPIKIII